ncbi:MAG: hypothetical protein Q4D51_02730 [Eubacteriales bacterium]|nr:hypothetical protein [Eubacteriales bacterium]
MGKRYRNFNVAVYCPVHDVLQFAKNQEAFIEQFKCLHKHVQIGKVYLENFRGDVWCEKDDLLQMKSYFEEQGIAVSGGITTCAGGQNEGYVSLCYSDEEDRQKVEKAIRMLAQCFDEIILDDFFFTNCRCPKCIAQKGVRSWSAFRKEQMVEVANELVLHVAKEENPSVNVIIKYPQWYEVYQETGYDLETESELFDFIYTGTETRNPDYAQQHLPKYLSYFIMTYLESAAPGRNLGGWFDPYECTYNLTSYLEQGYLTLFARAKEITIFCMGTLVLDQRYSVFAASLEQMFIEMDAYLDQLGNTVGIASYRPNAARGEDNIHSYLGMCGIPLIGTMQYPEDEKVVFLAAGAAEDKEIIAKMKKSLMAGADVICTSGFLQKINEAFIQEFVNVSYSTRKAFVKDYAITKDNGLSVSGNYVGREAVLIPQLDYCTNDIWELAAAYGQGMNYPIVLRCSYGMGRISVITIPDNMGDLYCYPTQVLDAIRGLFDKKISVRLDAPAGIMLFLYDNDCLVVRSDLSYFESCVIEVGKDCKSVHNLSTGKEIPVENGKVMLQLMPGVNVVLKRIMK